MNEICIDMGYGVKFRRMATSQDEIGWGRFMEGMICKEAQKLQEKEQDCLQIMDNGDTMDRWTNYQITRGHSRPMAVQEYPGTQQGSRPSSNGAQGGDSTTV